MSVNWRGVLKSIVLAAVILHGAGQVYRAYRSVAHAETSVRTQVPN